MNNKFKTTKNVDMTGLRWGGGQKCTFRVRFSHLSKIAFTLAEVLIVIGIIGIIADMTIPTLINNYQEKVTVVKLKKFYSIMNQVLKLAIIENDSPETWVTNETLTNPQRAEAFYDILKKNLKVTKDCGLKTDCMSNRDVRHKYLDGVSIDWSFTSSPNLAKCVLADGTQLMIEYVDSACGKDFGTDNLSKGVCMALDLDINGNDPPNVVGKDFFYFWLTKEGVVPRGILATDIYGKGANASAWIIYNGNMDYLHCDDLSWDGKRKCD